MKKNKKTETATPSPRRCRYFLVFRETKTLLGETDIPEGQDMDDAFPEFHRKNYPNEHYAFLVSSIKNGVQLVAESISNEKESWLLAYIDDNPDYWYGRESTLLYLGVHEFRHAS